jgi:hypothetical protein
MELRKLIIPGVVAAALVGAATEASGQTVGEKRCALTSPEAKRQSRFGAGIYFEQDSVIPWLGRWGGDQNYTMGAAFPVTGQWIHRKGLDWPLRGVDCLTGMLGAHNSNIVNGGLDAFQDFSMVLGYTAFTPRRLDLATPIHDDRPYAGLLFMNFTRLTVDPFARRALRSELTVGVLGLRIGEKVQTWIHTSRRENKGPDALTPYDPQGWPLQISDGGEPTARYTLALAKATSETEFHDVAWNTEASVGYYTNAALGATVRAGWLRSPFWAHNSNPLSAANQRLEPEVAQLSAEQPPKETVAERRARKSFEIAAFASGRLRVVGYNALLQGQFKDSPVTFNSAEINRAVLEGEVGLSVGVKSCSALLTFARRSAEFNVGQARAHTFGGVHLICGGGIRVRNTTTK